MNRCKRCEFPITALPGLIAKVTALLDLEVPAPTDLAPVNSAPPAERELYARIGGALGIATEALAISHGFCGSKCAAHGPRRVRTASA